MWKAEVQLQQLEYGLLGFLSPAKKLPTPTYTLNPVTDAELQRRKEAIEKRKKIEAAQIECQIRNNKKIKKAQTRCQHLAGKAKEECITTNTKIENCKV